MRLRIGIAKQLSGVLSLSSLAALMWSSTDPAAAQGTPAQAPSPFNVTSCKMSGTPVNMQEQTFGHYEMSTLTSLQIAYTNNRDVAASEVNFTVRYRGRTFKFVDSGAIKPHVETDRTFSQISGVYAGSSAECSITSATFADGTSWYAPGQTPVPAPR